MQWEGGYLIVLSDVHFLGDRGAWLDAIDVGALKISSIVCGVFYLFELAL